MDNAQAPALRNPSRTLAKVAVALLIVIAIAGFVLAGLKQRGGASAPAASADATHDAVPPLTVAPATADEPGIAANHITFAPGSDALSDISAAKVARIAEGAKQGHPGVSILSVVEAKADRAEQLSLARKRAVAIRQALQDHGIPLAIMRIQIQEVPPGSISAPDLNRLVIDVQ